MRGRFWMALALWAVSAWCWAAGPLPFEELLYKGKPVPFYGDAKTADHERIAELLKSRRLAERMAQLTQTVRLRQNLGVGFASCGQPNAVYLPQRSSIVFCYEMVDLIGRLAAEDREFTGPPTNPRFRENLNEVMNGVVWGIYLHELAHALIDINRIPITGREEDVADQFALFFAAKFIEPQGHRVVLPTVWFFRAMGKNRSVALDDPDTVRRLMADEHSLDEQRTYSMACWALGADQQWGAYPAAYVQLPQERAARCSGEFARLSDGIQARFRKYLLIR